MLSLAAEEACRERGAALMYLTVNGNNRGARALYERLGYAAVSLRAPAFRFLLTRPSGPRPVTVGGGRVLGEQDVQWLPRERAAAILAEMCGAQTLAPVDFSPLLSSGQYLGAVVGCRLGLRRW